MSRRARAEAPAGSVGASTPAAVEEAPPAVRTAARSISVKNMAAAARLTAAATAPRDRPVPARLLPADLFAPPQPRPRRARSPEAPRAPQSRADRPPLQARIARERRAPAVAAPGGRGTAHAPGRALAYAGCRLDAGLDPPRWPTGVRN